MREAVEDVGVGDVVVKRGGVELGQDVDPAKSRVDAAGDGDIDQAILAAEGNRRLGPFLGQGKEPFSPTAAQNKAKNL